MQEKVLFSIGSSTRSVEGYIPLLEQNGIERLVDVRLKTGSRTLHFDEKRFGDLLRLLIQHGILCAAMFLAPLASITAGAQDVRRIGPLVNRPTSGRPRGLGRSPHPCGRPLPARPTHEPAIPLSLRYAEGPAR